MRPGILVINKPAGITSHDVVDAVRRSTGEEKVGHAGTLDPFATGVLVVGIGRDATKVLGDISSRTEKSYRAIAHLGAGSDTDDTEGTIAESEDILPSKKQEVLAALKKFVGTIQQVPPVYSSTKVGGTRSYKRARKGELVKLGAHTVTVHSLALRSYHWPLAEFDVTCSSGTYIRSIARDLGTLLGVGAYLEALERRSVGNYTLAQAHTLQEISQGAEPFLLPIPKF